MSRSFLKVLAPAAAMIGALAIASPASAADTTFASYSGLNQALKATVSGSVVTLTETGTVVFSYINTSLASEFTGISANVVFTATAPTTDFSTAGSLIDQSGVSGSYVFTTTKPYVVNGTTYAAGSDLLSVVFTDGNLYGQKGGKTATLSTDNSIAGESVMYSSAFLAFIDTNQSDFSISLSAVTPKFTGTTKLSPFTGSPGGLFSADPVPEVVGSVPEPATWALMLVGFGAIGMGIRSAKRRDLRTA